MKPLFSIVLIARNESKTIPRMMESVREFQSRGGEILICDTGSTDNTIEVAKSLGCKVIEAGDQFVHYLTEQEVKDINERFIVENEMPAVKMGDKYFDFASARNYANSFAENDWICTVDCDEKLTKLDIDKINEIITNDPNLAHFEYNFVFSHKPDGGELIKFVQSKFFNKTKMCWKNIIHEMVYPINGGGGVLLLDENIFKLEHWQNQDTNRSGYLVGLAVDCFNHPDMDRNSHYFARELWFNGRPWSAAKEFKRHIDMKCWQAERAESMLFLCDIYGAMEHPEEQVEWAHKALQTDPNRREPLIKLAQIYMRRREWMPAKFYAVAALEIPWSGYYGSPKSFYENEPHEILFNAKGWLGDIEGAKKHLLECLKYEPRNLYYLNAIHFYWSKPKVSICIPTLGRPEKLERLLQSIKDNAGYDNYEIIVEEDKPMPDNEGVPTVLKRAVDKSTGELVMFLGNDCIMEPNCVQEAVWAMAMNFPEMDGLIGLNDSYWKGEVATHWLASKKLLPMLDGEFFHTGYYHTGCDSELTSRCKAMGKYAWAEHAVVFHDHPVRNGFKEGVDEIYAQAYAGPRHDHDDELYKKRSKEIGFEHIKAIYHPMPKTIFTIWLNEELGLPENVKECIKSLDNLKGYKSRVIGLDNCYHNKYIDECLSRHDVKGWVKAADYLRAWYIYNEGGIFLDADTIILEGKNFDNFLGDSLFACREDNGFIANGIFGALPGHPALKEFLDKVDTLDGTSDKVFENGMEIWTEIIYRYVENGEAKIYPQEYFLPYNHQTGETNITENTITNHLYNKSWK